MFQNTWNLSEIDKLSNEFIEIMFQGMNQICHPVTYVEFIHVCKRRYKVNVQQKEPHKPKKANRFYPN